MRKKMVKKLALFLIFILLSSLFSCCAQAAEIEKKSDNDFGIQAKSFILVDAGSGKIIARSNEHEKLHPASITKIMTIVLALEAIQQGKIKLTDKVTASELAMNMGGTEIWLEPGEQMTIQELLVAAAVGSANDACVALAEHISGSEISFVKLMNKKAKELGMNDTHYKNSNGLPEEGHHSSAHDIALLGQYAIKHYPQILNYTSIREHHLRGGKTWLVNTNNMLGLYKGMDGLKTGWTEEAGFCLAATAKRDGLRFISVVLGEENPKQRTQDTTALLNYGFANYSAYPVVKKGEQVMQLKVKRGLTDKVKLVAAGELIAAVPSGQEGKVKKEVFLTRKLVAPIDKGEFMGELRVRDNKGDLIGKVNLVAAEDVQKGGILRSILRFLAGIFTFWRH